MTNTIQYTGTWESYKDNIYVADIDDYFYDIDMTNYRVFFDGESGVEACYPNINCKYGIGIYGYPKDNADMSGSKIFNNLIVNLSTNQEYAYYAFEDGKEVARSGQFENGKIPVLSGSKAPLSGGNISGEVDENFLPKGNAIDGGILFEGFIGEYSGTNPCVGALESDGELFQYG